MRIRLRVLLLSLSAMVITVVILRSARFDAQQPSGRAGQPVPPTPTLGLDHGTLEFDTPAFTLRLVKDSQTVAAMQPKGAHGVDANTPFDFTPADQLTARQGDRFNHLGDITLRVKQQSGAWIDLALGDARKPVAAITSVSLPAGAKLLAAADLTPTLPGTSPVQVTRSWQSARATDGSLHFWIGRTKTSRQTELSPDLRFDVVDP